MRGELLQDKWRWPAVQRWMSRHRNRVPVQRTDGEDVAPQPPVKGIRRRRDKDLAACVDLLGLVHSEGQYPVYRPKSPRAWLTDESIIDAWVLERNGEMLGHIAIARVGQDALSALRWRELTGREPSELAGITQLFVRGRSRGQGIGSALLDVAVAEIRDRGLVPVLDVVDASTDAIKLYDDRGWRLRATYPWDDEHQIHYYLAPEPTEAD